MRLTASLLSGLLVATTVDVATAQQPGTVEISGLGVWHNKTTTMDALRAFGVGARVGVWLPANFELEAQLDYTRPPNSSVDNSFTLLYLAGNLLYNIPVSSGSIYLRGGYGKLNQSGCIFVNSPCSSHGALAGGAGFRVPVASSVQIRAEAMVRSRSTYDYTSVGGSLGVSFFTGSPSRSGGRPDLDDDGDGVGNRRDRCKTTPPGALVDDRGCSRDTDADGVPDGIDRCPGTPRGSTVDAIGCVKPAE